MIAPTYQMTDDPRLYEEQILRITALRIMKHKRKQVASYNPDKWSLNSFHTDPTSIFALEKEDERQYSHSNEKNSAPSKENNFWKKDNEKLQSIH